MIITGGTFRGRKIKTVKTREVRPTSSKVRESIFNMIQSSITDSVMLDLFAGSGIMGIEAVSRGASKVIFVEKNHNAARLLKENVSAFEMNSEIIISDALIALDRFKDIKFDIIFVDPPYAAGLFEPVLQKIKNNNLLNPDGIIVVEHGSKYVITNFAEEIGFSVIKEKKYGDTAITILVE